MFEAGLDVTVVPHLYDLKPDGTGMLALQGIKGDMIVCSWLYERAAHWILDRNGIEGHEGTTLIRPDDVDEDEEELEEEMATAEKSRVIESRDRPNRRIYCLDLRIHESADPYLEEIRRISTDATTKTVDLMGWVKGSPDAEQLERFQNPTNDVAKSEGLGKSESDASATPVGVVSDTPVESNGESEPTVTRIEETGGRRWYPVIDYSRCTNCMECIDFCLFGVYGVDTVETILVEQPDNCRKGCPACSRVCPENAIIFPQHKTPAIAGAEELAASLKIDLSKLFGAPESGKSAVDVAVLERDEQLMMAGRDVVGDAVGLNKRQPEPAEKTSENDNLDDLLDELDSLEL